MIEIKLPAYTDWKNKTVNNKLKHYSYKKGNITNLISIDGPLCFMHILGPDDEDDYTDTMGAAANQKHGDNVVLSPFASKEGVEFDGQGFYKDCIVGINNADFITSAAYKFNAIEILGGELGDKVQLQVLDTSAGTYSGVPNDILNQFGTNWNLRPGMYKLLPYEAKLYPGMIVRVVCTVATAKTIYVNLDLHKII